MKNKLLAALAVKLPVVATRESLLGLRAIDGEHLLAADNPQEFARHVDSLLRKKAAIDALAENGRRLIEQHYSWRTYGAELEQALASLVRDEDSTAVESNGELPYSLSPRRERAVSIAASEGDVPHV
jgi:glycosyltransferase involved in cell wall biosynthesis